MKRFGIKHLFIILCAAFLVISVAQKPIEEKPFFTNSPYKSKSAQENYTWNLKDIYNNEKEWQQDYNYLIKEMKKIPQYKGQLSKKTAILNCFKLNETLMRKLEKLYLYAHLKADKNQKDETSAKMLAKIEELSGGFVAQSAYIQPEILKLPESTIQEYLKSPELKNYELFFKSLLKEKAHMLSEQEERLLGMTMDMANSPKSIYDKLTIADFNFPIIKDPAGKDFQLSAASYMKALESKDRDFRRRGFEGILSVYNAHEYTLAALMNAQVKKDVFYARARKYNSALAAALSDEDMPKETYDNLINTVNKGLPALHKYIDLKKKVLKLDKIHEYDLFVSPYDKFSKQVTYEEAQKKLLLGLKPLGSKYLDDLQISFHDGWIDVFETENKYSGNYNTGCYDTHPYILLNYNNNFESMMTLAHEEGHALHTYYSMQSQEYPNAGVSILTSEVAAAVNELLMFDYLIKEAKDKQEKLFLMNKLLEDIRASVFTQVMFAEFEEMIHTKGENGEALTPEALNTAWKELRQKYYGKGFNMDNEAMVGWARIPHFYMNFYVYKYALSMAAARVIVNDLQSGDEKALQRYQEFLKSGSNDYPINLLKKAGVNVNTGTAVDKMIYYFSYLVDDYEKTLKVSGMI